ncbi:hypothetical protein FA95DRAFT_1613140 [Auriscalpium vulgare]|uniref:Uncharacterized protein n=1 Tax=Auriscalpium vulgare TaxID=40419 RepID=A0ACB8R3U0_9AGAM|nr:hypothetical protein FA95DRAFT_1613140 [Auriscalpium vulgare]
MSSSISSVGTTSITFRSPPVPTGTPGTAGASGTAKTSGTGVPLPSVSSSSPSGAVASYMPSGGVALAAGLSLLTTLVAGRAIFGSA